MAFQSRFFTYASQGPELMTSAQDTGRFQLKVRDCGEIAIELQDFVGLHDFGATANH